MEIDDTGDSQSFSHRDACVSFVNWFRCVYRLYAFVNGFVWVLIISLHNILGLLVQCYRGWLAAGPEFSLPGAKLLVASVLLLTIASDASTCAFQFVWDGLTKNEPPMYPMCWATEFIVYSLWLCPALFSFVSFFRSEGNSVATFQIAFATISDLLTLVAALHTIFYYMFLVLQTWCRLICSLRAASRPLVHDGVFARCRRCFAQRDLSVTAIRVKSLQVAALSFVQASSASLLEGSFVYVFGLWFFGVAWNVLKMILSFETCQMKRHFWLLEAIGVICSIPVIIVSCWQDPNPRSILMWVIGLFLNHCFLASIKFAHNEESSRNNIRLSFFFTFVLFALYTVIAIGPNSKDENGAIPGCFGQGSECKYIVPHTTYKYPFCGADLWDTGHDVIDYGLLAKLAYADPEASQQALGTWFPTWAFQCHHTSALGGSVFRPCDGTGDAEGVYDWTTFTEFRSLTSNLSVVAVRGTNNKMEWLLNADLWAPTAILQLSFFGWHLVEAWGVGSWALYIISIFTHLAYPKAKQSLHYSFLIDHTKYILQQGRQVVLTGHSLGGGLAKLAAFELCRKAAPHYCDATKVVAFSSPNVDLTGQLLGLDVHVQERSVNVFPDYDIVSRVDITHGAIYPVDCLPAKAFHCHLLEETLCELISTCGDGGRDIKFSPATETACKHYSWTV